jgi:hypothetical protein
MVSIYHEITEEEALRIAKAYDLYEEVKELLDDGMDPDSDLREWNLL